MEIEKKKVIFETVWLNQYFFKYCLAAMSNSSNIIAMSIVEGLPVISKHRVELKFQGEAGFFNKLRGVLKSEEVCL